jgi:hypothetical protein
VDYASFLGLLESVSPNGQLVDQFTRSANFASAIQAAITKLEQHTVEYVKTGKADDDLYKSVLLNFQGM